MFSVTNSFEKQLKIQINDSQAIKPTIDFFSFTKAQKAIGITLTVLALLALIIGLASIAGGNFANQKIAQVIMGIGSGIAVVTIASFLVVHLLFKKRVDNYLKSRQEDWNNWNADINYTINNETNTRYNLENWHLRLFKNEEGERHIAFYRTDQIEKENYSIVISNN